MKYKATIVNNYSKQSVESEHDTYGNEFNANNFEYIWTDGNYGCDCNRHLFFMRARGIPENEIASPMCGDTHYSVPYLVGDNGTKIIIDG